MTTIRGIAKSRWWVLVAAGLLAWVVSGRLAEHRNDNLPPFESMASVTFYEDPQALEREDFETMLETQLLLAEDVNSGVLDETPGAFIPWLLAEVDLENEANQIQFIARGYTQEDANELAQTMRDNFLAVSNVGAGLAQTRTDLQDLTAQIGELRREIAQLQAATPLTEAELAQQTQRAALENQVLALQAHYGNLTTQLMNPELVLRTPESIQAEMERTLTELTTLEAQLATYPLPPDPTIAAQGNEELQLKQLQLENFIAAWNQLFITERQLEALSQSSEIDERPVTLDAASTTSNQALALFGAVAAALIGLVGIERGRGMLWSAKDLDEGPPVIAELPPRPLDIFHHPSNQPWYLETQGGQRKASIQMLRSLLDDHDNAVIAFQGSGVFREDIREMTADIAVAVAVSGRSVLLLDTSFENGNRIAAWGPEAGATLSSLLHGHATEREELVSEFKTALLSSPEVVHGLRALRSGNGQRDAADVLSGYRFEILLEVAREIFDLVLVSGSNLGEAASHVLAQRVDSVILVASAGHTVTRSLEAADRDFAIRRATLVGVVMLRRRRSRFARSVGIGLRSSLWRTIDRFSEGKASKEGKEGGGAHIRSDE